MADIKKRILRNVGPRLDDINPQASLLRRMDKVLLFLFISGNIFMIFILRFLFLFLFAFFFIWVFLDFNSAFYHFFAWIKRKAWKREGTWVVAWLGGFRFLPHSLSAVSVKFFLTILTKYFGLLWGSTMHVTEFGCGVSDPCECSARVKSQNWRWSMRRGENLSCHDDIFAPFSGMLRPGMMQQAYAHTVPFFILI